MYLTLKQIHFACVVLSIFGFILRGIWMFLDTPIRQHKLVRILPHVVDTILLAAGVGLAIMLSQYPLTHPWLTAKVIGLLIYIVLGFVALRLGKTKALRAWAFASAVLVFGYIMAVAFTKNPGGWLV